MLLNKRDLLFKQSKNTKTSFLASQEMVQSGSFGASFGAELPGFASQRQGKLHLHKSHC